MKDKVLTELKNVFRPEFLNRIDSTVVFRPLSEESIRKVVDLELIGVTKQLASKGITLEVTDAAKDWLGVKGYDQAFGARPLKRLISDSIEDKLSEMLLGGQFAAGDTVRVDTSGDEGGGLAIEKAREPAPVA
jgi:ATP-dependent Clp protease ATP-binding subunit ClpC